MQRTVRFSAIAAIIGCRDLNFRYQFQCRSSAKQKRQSGGVSLRPRTEKAVHRGASASKQHARVSPKGARNPLPKMCCIGEQYWAQVR